MTISATRRFIDLIGEVRLKHGSHKTERGLANQRKLIPFLNGKEATIVSLLYPKHAEVNPYLPGSDLDDAYRSGAAIERADLNDVVRRCKS